MLTLCLVVLSSVECVLGTSVFMGADLLVSNECALALLGATILTCLCNEC